MTGRHRADGRHRKPVQHNPRRRRVGLRIICGCAACAVVIPLFFQSTATANPPDLTAAPTGVASKPTLVPVPPALTLLPSVDTVGVVTEVNSELAKHHDSSKNIDDSSRGDSPKSDSASPSSDTPSGHHSHDDSNDYHQTAPPANGSDSAQTPHCQ